MGFLFFRGNNQSNILFFSLSNLRPFETGQKSLAYTFLLEEIVRKCIRNRPKMWFFYRLVSCAFCLDYRSGYVCI